jgi:ABC-2 type transport system ATP-binding protein
MDILRLSHVSKAFGSKKVLEDLSFAVPEHSVFGFIGENGAGKTTTMKMILGLLCPDSGTIEVCGERVTFGENKTKRYIGYLPDVPEFYGFMTPAEYLAMCGSIAGLGKEEIRRKSEELLELVGLSYEKKRIHGFSRGMKQRLGIAQALLGNPRLLICDEPTSALDPVGRREILNILTSVREHTTVIFSTHILSDVERICDCAAFLHNGEIALEGSIEDMKRARGGSGLEIEFVRSEDKIGFEKVFPGGIPEGEQRLRYEKKTEEEGFQMLAYLMRQGIVIRRYEVLEPTLENLFMEVLGK